ncbi:hypothetical protein ASPTUDRAFT_41605 [Aspergillus tubingensis CBS 134.48]|uniref:Secreted protein n=1 Tax=Aspergillus tubingensis (strain CBS 134.48) TaxID=767770 RepID=A0A1L9N8E2_ASPTC|nr:hypothetical protein ASPTUDRAFT_41605 [Aspergillus tubingensis CBS 134.48]
MKIFTVCAVFSICFRPVCVGYLVMIAASQSPGERGLHSFLFWDGLWNPLDDTGATTVGLESGMPEPCRTFFPF